MSTDSTIEALDDEVDNAIRADAPVTGLEIDVVVDETDGVLELFVITINADEITSGS